MRDEYNQIVMTLKPISGYYWFRPNASDVSSQARQSYTVVRGGETKDPKPSRHLSSHTSQIIVEFQQLI